MRVPGLDEWLPPQSRRAGTSRESGIKRRGSVVGADGGASHPENRQPRMVLRRDAVLRPGESHRVASATVKPSAMIAEPLAFSSLTAFRVLEVASGEALSLLSGRPHTAGTWGSASPWTGGRGSLGGAP